MNRYFLTLFSRSLSSFSTAAEAVFHPETPERKSGKPRRPGFFPAVFILLLCFSLCGCGSSEDPAKADMQTKTGVNQEIAGSYDKELAVKCRNGTFVGQADGPVHSYKGIPYAEPPVGDFRWKRPVPAVDREGIYEALYFGKSPIQTEWPSEVGSYYPRGEDCLTLNVWTNENGPSQGKTVMVFFHGGSYGWGGTSDPMYDGHNLVEKYPDLVLVTAEYRTGIMGFIDFSSVPGGQEYAESGNLGLLDQVCALQWVQKNIEAFGGNPENVTIFGESAGGGSVSLLPLIKGTDGLFRRIIAESGSVSLTSSRAECEYLTSLLLKKSGCRNMEELTALSEEELMVLNEDLNDSNNFPERDGVVLPADLYGAWERKKLAGIDMMTGTNAQETRYWIREMGYEFPGDFGMFFYEQLMPFMYENNLRDMSSDERDLAEAFVHDQSGKKVWQLSEFYNELVFRVPALEQAARHAKSGGKSYIYYWTMPGADEMLGACHAIELSYVFNNPQVTIYNGDLYNQELADTVQDMWVGFARSGDPSTSQYSWKPYTAKERNTMVLGEEISLAEDLKPEQRAMIEPLLGHYFNGLYSQLDLMVPQFWKLLAKAAIVILLIAAFLFKIIRSVRKRKKQN